MSGGAELLFRQHQQQRLALLRGIVADGETCPSRVLAALDQACRASGTRASGRLTAPAAAADFTDADFYPACPLMPTGVPTYAFATVAGSRTMRPFYGDYDELSLNQVADAVVRHRIDAVVELGADFGQRLLQVFLRGGPRIPYFAAEAAEDGRQGVSVLAALQPDMDLRAVALDMGAPDWSFLAGFRRVLVFSHLSLSACPTLATGLFEGLAQAAPAVWGMHYEAVGHQVKPAAAPAWFRPLIAAQQLNRDFIPRLLDAHNHGVVRCDLLSPDLYDLSTGFPVTVAWWQAGDARPVS